VKLLEDFLALGYRKSHALNTKESVRTAVRKFEKFCQETYDKDLIETTLAKKNNSKDAYKVLDEFITWLDQNGVRTSTIHVWVSYARQFMIYNDIEIKSIQV